MKKILLVTVIFLAAGTLAYAQQSDLPSSAEVRQQAQQFLNQARANTSEIEGILADLRARNSGNRDIDIYNRLRAEIEHLEGRIKSEEVRIGVFLDQGMNVSAEMLNRIERMVNQHKAKQAELEAFIAS